MNISDGPATESRPNGHTPRRDDAQVVVIDLPSWEAFHKQIADFTPSGRYIWRGQRQAWPLISVFDRHWQGPPSARSAALDSGLRRFKHEMGQAHPQIRLGHSESVWWALGQHYGLKTPLLDWTHSPYVAAYFAFAEKPCETDDGYRHIYALDQKSLRRLIERRSRARFIEVIDKLDYPSQRFSVQRSVLTRALNGDDIETNVRRYAKRRPNRVFVQLRIPAGHRRRCLRSLDLMNINYQTLLLDLRSVVDACDAQMAST